MKKVVAGFDTSKSAAVALSVATDIAESHGGTVNALYVEDERELSYVPLAVALGAAVGVAPQAPRPLRAEQMVDALAKVGEQSEEVRAAYTLQMEPRLSKLSESLYRIPELRIERGLPWELLAQAARSADYVVMGRVGSGNDLRDLSTPEISEAVAKEVIAPLLLVTQEFSAPTRIVLAYDGSEPANRVMRALPALVAPLSIESIVIMVVGEHEMPAEEALSVPLEYLEQCGVELEVVLRKGEVVESILAVVKEKGANLVAAGAFGAKGMRHLLWGSATKALLSEQGISLLLSR